jgi:hypothetical protein
MATTIDRHVRNMLSEARSGRVAPDEEVDRLPAVLQSAVRAAVSRVIAMVASGQRPAAARESDDAIETLHALADREGLSLGTTVKDAPGSTPSELAGQIDTAGSPRDLARSVPRW